MKLIKSLTFIAFLSTFGIAQTTMCFKQNHKDFMTLESVKLDGGLCNGTNSLSEMKNNGWKVDDIKIDGNNYIYILKKDEQTLSSLNMTELENKILKRLEQKEVDDNKVAIAERRAKMSISGKNFYINKCQNCHGEKADELPGNSRALTTMNLYDFKTTIRDYNNGNGYDRGTAFQMRPFAAAMDSNDVKNVYIYIQSITKNKSVEN